MERFAFIFHPHDIESLGDWVLEEPNLKLKRRKLAERALRWFPPFKRATVTGIRSLVGNEIEGDMILWPMIPEQIVKMSSEFTTTKLIEAGRLAQRLGAKVVGLGAFAACVGKRGTLLAQSIDIPVTTGTCYTIAVAIQATLNAASSVGINLTTASVAVIGATGSIGEVCATVLARNVGKIILVARNEERLITLATSLRDNSSTEVTHTRDIDEAVGAADIIIICTSSITPVMNLKGVRAGSVVCDISLPHNIKKEEATIRPDVLVIDGGVVKPPGDVDFHFYFGLKKGLAYACMAETMLLTLEEIYTSYSLGGNISVLKIVKMAQLARKHGFRIADFMSFGRAVSASEIERVKEVRMDAKLC